LACRFRYRIKSSRFSTQRVVATGGDEIIYNGEWKIHRFNGSGTFTLTSFIRNNNYSNLEVDYLIVAGGGGGGTNMGGGGGGGGALSGSTTLSPGDYTITVGAGGSGAPAGTGTHPTTVGSNGSNSSFNGMTAYGGGYGGLSPNTYGYADGNDGGCGGGASGYRNDSNYASGGSGVSGQGYSGGNQAGTYYSGGGGGAGEAGTSAIGPANGGNGLYCDILGKPFYFGGGGGGAGYSTTGGFGGYGGGGGGAIGDTCPSGTNSVHWGYCGTNGNTSSQANVPGGDGGPNTGGGGGGGSHYNYTNEGGDGGSGIVVIRYKYK
jgi:fibronectin-binding autotransporter adhesin